MAENVCGVCGAPRATCTGATGPVAPVDSPYRGERKVVTVGLHEYNIKARTLGNNSQDTTLLLSEEDAEAQGLTAKDRVSSADLLDDADDSDFKPETYEDLAPGGTDVAGAKQAAAPKNKAAASGDNK